jgi:hypothetical protein
LRVFRRVAEARLWLKDGLHDSLGQVGDGVGGFGFYIAEDNGRDEACQGGAEIAGGEVVRMGRRSYFRPAIGVGFERAEAGNTVVIPAQETVDELTERIETLAYDS